MSFKIKYKKSGAWFYKTETVEGISLQGNRMVLVYPDGGIKEIPDWDKHYCVLGTDWVATTKKSMEKDAGQPVVLDRG